MTKYTFSAEIETANCILRTQRAKTVIQKTSEMINVNSNDDVIEREPSTCSQTLAPNYQNLLLTWIVERSHVLGIN